MIKFSFEMFTDWRSFSRLTNEVEGESYRHNGERHQPQYAHHDPEPLLSVGVALHHRPQALRPI